VPEPEEPPTLTVVQRVEREEDSARGMLLADDAIHSATRFDRISVSQGLGHLSLYLNSTL
jgi:hypothetical protein